MMISSKESSCKDHNNYQGYFMYGYIIIMCQQAEIRSMQVGRVRWRTTMRVRLLICWLIPLLLAAKRSNVDLELGKLMSCMSHTMFSLHSICVVFVSTVFRLNSTMWTHMKVRIQLNWAIWWAYVRFRARILISVWHRAIMYSAVTAKLIPFIVIIFVWGAFRIAIRAIYITVGHGLV